MGIVHVQLPDELKTIIDRQVAEGRAGSREEFIAAALRLYADHLDAEDEVAAMVGRADEDLAAGRFVTVTTDEDAERLHEAAMARLRARLAEDTPKT